MGAREAAESGISRGQSNPIAIVLIFGLVIASTTIVVAFGASAITTTQNQLDSESVESRMAQLDSQMATVALGSSDSQEVALGSTSSNAYNVNGSAGRISVSSSTEGTIIDTSMGAVVYEGDNGDQVAYQGGGVWRTSDTGGSVMVSPPEFHYEGGTLTLPLVTINNNASFSGDAVVSQNGTTKHHPDGSLENPLQGGTVTVTITSEFHQAWATFLESRNEGAVTHEPSNQRVEMVLTVPVTETFDSTVGTTDDGSGAITPSGNFESPTETGVNAPSADMRIDNKIEYCNADPDNCDDLPNGGTLGPGTYFADDANNNLPTTTYNTGSGNIDVVVDGNFDFSGMGGSEHTINGDGQVTFYVRGDVAVGGNTEVNKDGDAAQLLTMVDSGGTVAAASGTPQYTGLIYAPDSELTINGGGMEDNIVGSAIVKSATGNGNGNAKFQSTPDYELKFDSAAEITYLHVSENSVNVTAQ